MGETDRFEKDSKWLRILVGGVVLIILGIIGIILISPYRECGILSGDWLFCEGQLKSSSELFLEYSGFVFLMIAGAFIVFLKIFELKQNKSFLDYLRSRSQKSAMYPHDIREARYPEGEEQEEDVVDP